MNRSRKRPAPHRHKPEIQKERFAPCLLLFRNFALIQFAIRNRAQPGAPLSVSRCCAIGAATAARSRFFQRLARPGLALAIAALFSFFLPTGGRFGERRCGVGLASRRAWQEYRFSPARLQALRPPPFTVVAVAAPWARKDYASDSPVADLPGAWSAHSRPRQAAIGCPLPSALQ